MIYLILKTKTTTKRTQCRQLLYICYQLPNYNNYVCFNIKTFYLYYSQLCTRQSFSSLQKEPVLSVPFRVACITCYLTVHIKVKSCRINFNIVFFHRTTFNINQPAYINSKCRKPSRINYILLRNIKCFFNSQQYATHHQHYSEILASDPRI
jgi:hypothetical protein